MSESKWLECHDSLLHGNYDHWPQHEWIRSGNPAHKHEYVSTETYGKPIWQGAREPIRLLINADFGMGDTIHFWRFVPLVNDRVAHVVLRCDEDFKTLFHDVQVVGKDEPLPEFDKIIHMMALPYVLGVRKEQISGLPYIEPNQSFQMDQALSGVLQNTKSSKIGVCASGNPFNPRDSIRSLPPAFYRYFINLFPYQMRFFSLNKLKVDFSEFYDMRGYMADWNATAHLVKYMDVVISVDTAVAHLAGALGVPVWNIVPTVSCDWRWGVEGDRTLWYDSMRIYRMDDWKKTIYRIAEELQYGRNN